MSEQRDETRPPGCMFSVVECKFRVHDEDAPGFVRCESCGHRFPLQDALNAMFARLEAAEKR